MIVLMDLWMVLECLTTNAAYPADDAAKPLVRKGRSYVLV